MCATGRMHAVIKVSLCLLTLFFARSAGAQARSEGTAELAGVVQGVDGMPVILHLRALDPNPVRYYDGYEETTTKDGRFHFAMIQPGTYQMEAKESGIRLAATPVIHLRNGESRKGIVLSAKRGISLCGRVTENGRAKNDTWVDAYWLDPEFGTLSQTFVPHLGREGRFSVPVSRAGTYYLAGYTSYYPGSFSFNGAKAIVVGEKAGLACDLEIPLQYTGCSATMVSGRITTLSGDPTARGTDKGASDETAKYKVQFLSTNPSGGTMAAVIAMNSSEVYRSGDTFSTTVCQGNYDVVLSDEQQVSPWQGSPTHKVIFDRRNIEVGAAPIVGVELTPHAMATISGEVPGMSHNVSCPAGGPRAHVSILREGDGQFQSVVLDEKNRFTFRNVDPGEYTVSAGPFLHEAFFLESVVIDGRAIDGRRFTVAQAQPMTMVIKISGDVKKAAGHLTSEVRSESRWEVGWTRPKGSVAGRLLTGKDVSTRIKLQSIRYNSNASGEYEVQADREGNFRFDSVDPGVYNLRAEGKGILTTEYGALKVGQRGTPIVVTRGTHIQNLTLSPARLSTVCGRVTNPGGEPRQGARIFLMWSHGGSIYGDPSVNSEVLTDADGRFRMEGLAPGEYFLTSPLDVNRVVYFSEDGTLSTASPVTVEAGRDAGCGKRDELALRVPGNYQRTYTVRGKVNGNLAAANGDRFWLWILAVSASGEQQPVATAKLDAEHHFTFENVPGGHFVLQLHGAYGPEPIEWSGPYGPVEHLLASQKIAVREGMEEISLTPMPLPMVIGSVHFSQVPAEWKNNFDVAAQRITLAPRQYRAPFSARLAEDGSFQIGPEDPGDYQVNLDLRAPLYIRSVKLDGCEIRGRYIHLESVASAKLEVEVSGESGQVNATVLPDHLLPRAEPSVTETCSKSVYPQPVVVLFPEPAVNSSIGEKEAELPRLLESTRYGDQNNPTLQILAVPPGRYRALAVESLAIESFPFMNPHALSPTVERVRKTLAALGEPITVKARETLEIAVPDRTLEVYRAAAKLGVAMQAGVLE